MLNPVSTYRIQFHKDFTLNDFEKILSYLKELGVKTVYASPIFKATPGSMHGYDGVDPNQINPEIGDKAQLISIHNKLKQEDMYWLQDIVPNHMAFHQKNDWLMDVLEKGQKSSYISFFDIDWNSKFFDGKVMVPFLGSDLEEIIKNKELRISFNNGKFFLAYYDNFYPLNFSSYVSVLQSGENIPAEVNSIIDQLNSLTGFEEIQDFSKKWNQVIDGIKALAERDDILSYIESRVEAMNSNPKQILDIALGQVYRLCCWKDTDSKINYRRFFTINGLICLNIQNGNVFEEYHRLTNELLKGGVFQGLRIDHIDGLNDPGLYLEKLRALSGEETFIIVEKILEQEEQLPHAWNIQGNTGYDFLSLVNNLFTNQASEDKLTNFYHKLINEAIPVKEQVREKKSYILYQHMAGELENLLQLFLRLDLVEEKVISNLGPSVLKQAIAEFLIACPVYRFYGNQFPLSKEESEAVGSILKQVRVRRADLAAAVTILEQVMLVKPKEGNEDFNQQVSQFYKRCMQFTGPLMAKGVEDTLMYTYNRFIVHNEVGDSSEAFGISSEDFHTHMLERQKYWPLSLNGTATHDTKRGEDVSARLNVISDLPDVWIETVLKWQEINQGLKINQVPDVNDEYFIYQTLVGSYPMVNEESENYKERLQAYLVKALREGKKNSNWTNPNEEYEGAIKNFVDRLLQEEGPFLKSFQEFYQKVIDFGIINSLSKVALKFTCPGVPDIYQGCEMWDLSMVDPDNRRAVDFEKRKQLLEGITSIGNLEPGALGEKLWKDRYDGSVKLWLTHTLLQERNNHSSLFAEGHYYPLKVKGKYKDHIHAFARRLKEEWFVTIIPLNLASLGEEQQVDIQSIDWKKTRVILPAEAPTDWEDVVLKRKGNSNKGVLIQDLFQTIPIGLLKLKAKTTDRGAGILMHITSLPSRFGVGDFGPEARRFADFLSAAKQKYWQLLPITQTEAGNGHSPYSSISSMAGNTLLISPELLAEEGLLDKEDYQDLILPSRSEVDYSEEERIKNNLFEKAYRNFLEQSSSPLHHQFKLFCEQESAWLEDYSLYVTLKKEHGGKGWFDWKEEYKLRRENALNDFSKEHQDQIRKVKWLQFIFIRQWKGLRTYCNTLNIKMFGDLPFYVSYDSADVWSNPEIFSLDTEGKLVGVAGVPPDYFNSDGQLWGMPVFRWDVLKQQNYDWWIRRLKKNIELFDLVRLDHFRAFADYWEVPASEKTAKNGSWKLGPGSDFFNVVKEKLGSLPFIAEDLGEITDIVVQLREEFQLPGMKILQFAFGDDMANSIFIPHNYNSNFVAYTGTHDNNTSIGWYRQNTSKTERKNLERYIGAKVKEREVNQVLARMAYGSVANIVILPVQDIIGLDESGRMNVPASMDKNWLWRLKPNQLTDENEKQLRDWVDVFGRG